MGNTYGDAWIELLYDIDTEVRITNPSQENMDIHKIKPTTYLVLHGTDKKFPEGILIGVTGISYEPKTIVKPGNPYPKYEQIKIEECKSGQIYPVTLVSRVIHVDSELEIMGIPRLDKSNRLTFQPGELERRLSSAKTEFFAKLEVCNLRPEKQRVYFRLVGSNPYF